MSQALTPAQYRRLRITRGVLLTCIVGSLLTLAITIWLFVAAGTSSTWRAVSTAVFVEFAASAAVLGAFAKCPACSGRLGSEAGDLLPRRCPRCGVRLAEPTNAETGESLR